MGAVWELGKLLLGSEGQHNLTRGTLLQRARTTAQVAFSLVLAAGSVAASLGFFVQSDHAQQQAALSASPSYRREVRSLQDFDQAVTAAMFLAAQMRQADHITASRRQQDKAEKLRQERDALSAKMARQESHAHLASINFFEQMALVLASSKHSQADSLRFGAPCVLAVALDAIGMIFLAKLRAFFLFDTEDTYDSGDEEQPLLRLARATQKPKARRHHARAAQARNQTIAKGRGDTGTDPNHEHGTRYRTCVEEVMSGALKPCYEALIERFRISATTARNWLHRMQEAQLLAKKGRFFVVATTADKPLAA